MGLSPPVSPALAWNGEKIDPALFNDRLKEMKIGDTIQFTVFRGDKLLTIPISIGAQGKINYSIKEMKDAGPEQQRVFESWLNENVSAEKKGN